MNILNTNARWIWGQENFKNQWRVFKKSFFVKKVPHNALLKVGCETRYWLWINGELIVKDSGLNRGPTPKDGYYETINISKNLNAGENNISILVWYWGNEGRNNKDCGQGGLIAEISGTKLEVLTDTSWKTKICKEFYHDSEPNPSVLYGGYNILFNANYYEEVCECDVYNFNGFDNAKEIAKNNEHPFGNLWLRPIPLWKDYGLKEYSSVEYYEFENKVKIIAHLPYAAHISPYIDIECAKNRIIDIRTDRYSINGGIGDHNNLFNSHRGEYKSREGNQSYEYFSSLYGEKVIYTVPKDVIVKSIKFRETGYDCELLKNFSSNDEFLNKLYDKCQRTLYVCMRDNFMDCPDREKGQWIGDVSVQVPQVFLSMSESAISLVKKAILDFINWKNGDILWGNVPGVCCFELPGQTLNAISEFGMIRSYYEKTKDKDILSFCFKPIKNYLMLWKLDENSLVVPRKGNWYWFDHGVNVDSRILENAWYYSALKNILFIANEISSDENIKSLQERKKLIEMNFNKTFCKNGVYTTGEKFNANGELVDKNCKYVDERANAMATLVGLADEKNFRNIKDVLELSKNCTPYMEGYVLEALFLMGFRDVAIKRMKDRYKQLVENENSTLWEDFDILGTRNHAWSGAPLKILHKWFISND